MFFETKDLIADKLTLFDTYEFHRICNQPFIIKQMEDWEMDLNQVNNIEFITLKFKK